MSSAGASGGLPIQIQQGADCATLSFSANIAQDKSLQVFLVQSSGGKTIAKERLVNDRPVTMVNRAGATFSLRTDPMPTSYKLYQNYPNPFNPNTTIEFDLPVAATVDVAVYDILGRRVAVLASHRTMESGTQSLSFDAGAYASGVYLYRLDAVSADPRSPGKYSETRKMLLVK
jgi:hypothetical protein